MTRHWGDDGPDESDEEFDDIVLTVVDDEADHDEFDPSGPTWKILVVDDEEVVHDATRLALSQLVIEGRPLELISAFTAAEAVDLARAHPDIAVALIDVVMETNDAGLVLVKRIREELGNRVMQLVVRTGQPGYAPEETVVTRYAINAYITKSDLTRTRLLTVIATSVRSFTHLVDLQESRAGLAAIVDASARLTQHRSVADLGQSVLRQLETLRGVELAGIFCVSTGLRTESPIPADLQDSPSEGFRIVAATGDRRIEVGAMLGAGSVGAVDRIARLALGTESHQFGDGLAALYLATPSGWEAAVAVEGDAELAAMDPEQLRALCLNVELGLENAQVFSRLEKFAYYDIGTSLLSRRGLERDLLEFESVHQSTSTVYALGIERYDDVVASFGSAFGSELVAAVGLHLRRRFGTGGEPIGRLHADVVGLVSADSELLDALMASFRQPLMIDDKSIHVAVSAGKAQVNGFVPAAALDAAEVALYAARERADTDRVSFDPARTGEARDRLELVNGLRAALASEDELFLQFQPKVRVVDGQVVGFEALVRWRRNDGTIVRPDQFLHAAEVAGLYDQLDTHVAGLAAAALREHPEFNQPLAINVTPHSLQNPSFARRLFAEFDGCPEWNHRIEIEVTEEALVGPGPADETLADFVEAGVRVALDDFGTGYSSIGYLLRLPVDTIKIDGIFVRDIVHDPKARRLLEWVLGLAADMGKDVVIECIETDEQLTVVSELGAPVVQGYYYSPPVGLGEALSMMSRAPDSTGGAAEV